MKKAKYLLLATILLAIKGVASLGTPFLLSPTTGAINISPNYYFSWQSVSGATNYQIKVAENSGFTNATIFNSSSTTYYNTTLRFGTQYYWQVRAQSTTDSSTWSAAFSFLTVDTIILSTPVTGLALTTADLSFTWYGLYGIDPYQLNYDTSATFTSAIATIVNRNQPNYTANNLYFGKKYYWRVRAVNAVDTSNWSTPWNFTTISRTPIVLASPFNNSSRYYVNISLWYNTITGLAGYITEIDTSLNFNSSLRSEQFNTSWGATFNNLRFNTKYYWHVKGINAVDSLPWSTVWSFTVTPSVELDNPTSGSTNIQFNVPLNYFPFPGVVSYDYEVDTTLLYNSSVKKTANLSTGTISTNTLRFATKYYWRMRAISAVDTSAWCTSWSFVTADVALANPTQNATGLSPAVSLNYWGISGATGYDFELDTSLNFNSSAYQTYSRTTSGTQLASGLLFGKKYYWRMRARNVADTSHWCAPWNFTIMDKPTLVSPANNTTNTGLSVQLQWSTYAGADYYQIQYSEYINFSIATSTVSSVGFLNLVNLKYGAVYYWRVRLIHSNDTSQWSSAWKFTTNYLLGSTTLLSPVDYSTNNALYNLVVKYTSVPNATKYEIEWDRSTAFDSAKAGESIDTSFTIDTLKPAQYYSWRVRGKDSQGYGPWIAGRFRTLVLTLGTPTLLSPANNTAGVSNSNTYLTWYNVNFAADYEMQYDQDSLFTNPVSRTPILGAAVTINSLYYNTKYFWRVRARSGAVMSSWSSVWNFTTLSLSLNAPSLSYPAAGQTNVPVSSLSLTWYSVSNASNYEVQYDTTINFTNPVNNTTTNLALPLSPLPYNTTYYWRVRAKNNNVYSSWSGIRSFTTAPLVLTAPALVLPINGATSLAINNVRLDWDSVANAMNYEVQYDVLNTFTNPSSFTTSNLNYVISSLSNNTKYYWRVRSKSNSILSNWSTVWNFTTVPKALIATTLLAPANNSIDVSRTGLKLMWLSVSNVTLYEYQVGEDVNFTSGLLTASISDTSITLSVLKPLTKYYWHIRSYNTAQTGLWSTIWTFTTSTNVGITLGELVSSTKIFPNPCTESLLFLQDDIDANELHIYSMEGNEIKLPLVKFNTPNSVEINVQTLSSGLYLLKYSNRVYRFVKQ